MSGDVDDAHGVGPEQPHAGGVRRIGEAGSVAPGAFGAGFGEAVGEDARRPECGVGAVLIAVRPAQCP